MSDELINKYRPKTLEQVVGHADQVAALRTCLQKKRARQFLFTGPSGTGKTTLARICASELGIYGYELREMDAAIYGGVEDMRGLVSEVQHRPIEQAHKGVILDEVHAVSKAAANALLKALEEPPEWAYWFLCTTEPAKILPTIRTRVYRVDLKPLPDKALLKLLNMVVSKEKFTCTTGVIDECVAAAEGSARQALSNLAVCAEVRNSKKAARLLENEVKAAEAHELARVLMFSSSWREAQAILKRLTEVNPEGVRRVVRAYVDKVVRNNPKDAICGRGCEVLDVFDKPFDDHAAVTLAVGKVLLG